MFNNIEKRSLDYNLLQRVPYQKVIRQKSVTGHEVSQFLNMSHLVENPHTSHRKLNDNLELADVALE